MRKIIILSLFVLAAVLVAEAPADAQTLRPETTITARVAGASPVAKLFGIDYSILSMRRGATEVFPVYCFGPAARVCARQVRETILTAKCLLYSDPATDGGLPVLSLTLVGIEK